VKGSGWDLETIRIEGFSPVRLAHLKKLSQLPYLSDSSMVNELVTHLTVSSAPVPSVEAILHAIIPFRYVDHTHADAVVAISNSAHGEEIIREIYGDLVVYVPYVMPGFDLSKNCSEILKTDLTSDKIGILLLNHGVFSFGDTAVESYDRMMTLVGIAEKYLQQHASADPSNSAEISMKSLPGEIAALRKEISMAAGFPIIIKRLMDKKTAAFCNRGDLSVISGQGPATPDHVIRTKRLPLVGRDVSKYVEDYKSYFAQNEPLARERKQMLDPAPRVILDPELGLCAVGRTGKDANMVADIYYHTIDIIQWADKLGGYKALSAKDIFDVEYWELEQAKMSKAGKLPEFAGEVALVTGAASGIGKACVTSLLQCGSGVVGLDINPAVETLFPGASYCGITCDITSESQLIRALDQTINVFGGLDMLILNAGVFPASKRIDTLETAEWDRVMKINLDANFFLLRDSYPFLKLAPKGGRVVIIGSKNVAAPGPGAAAYSASKAALNQLARVAALEWGKDGIRVNSIHPNAVFDTGIWTNEVLATRAASYGLTTDAYRKNNILKTEVKSTDVSNLVVQLCGACFSKTTGAQIPIDGGNERVI
jgi:rhamnose utilization protein RhaD (predicted bifunctional aldolase and dehydrogenase)/NAD(P)-dependent dehydrogenase (short-subunit alcohol dehydrogenase family)